MEEAETQSLTYHVSTASAVKRWRTSPPPAGRRLAPVARAGRCAFRSHAGAM